MLRQFLVSSMFIFSASASHAAPMTFSLEGSGGNCQYGCQWIKTDGEITQNTASDYQKFIESLDRVPILVYLNGYGKDVIAALELGKLFRQKAQSVYVAESIPAIQSSHAENVTRGACYATCAYALLGGVSYGIKDPKNGVGHEDSIIVLEDVEELLTYKSINVAKMGLSENGVDFTKGALKNYLEEMGTDPVLTKQILNVNGYLTIRINNADKYHLQKHRTKFPFKF